MPTFFLVLMRFFLRVDGVIFRLYETRIFHEFNTNLVIRDVQHKEASYDFISKKLPYSAPNQRDLSLLTNVNWVAQHVADQQFLKYYRNEVFEL